MTPAQANALTAVGLAALLAAVAFSSPRWAGALSAPAVAIEGEEPGTEPPAPAAEASPVAARRISVRLYFEAPDREGLLPEEREIAFSSDLAVQLRTVVEELAKGSTTGLLSTLPAGTRVLDVFVHAGGVAYVDLSGEVASGLPGGSRAERLTVFSLVDSIVQNFPSTSRVRLLVDGHEVSSLAGHIDLSRPLAADLTVLATEAPVAAASPQAPAPPAAAPRTPPTSPPR
jgi:hypothetical protein